MESFRLSEYGGLSSVPAPVSRMMASFAADFRDGCDVNLGVGYVNENTIPGRLVREALGAVLRDPGRYRGALNYGGPQGSPNLIESIRRFHVERGIGGLTEEILARQEIVIGASGATSLLEGAADVLAPGIVVTSDPMYYIYCNVLRRKGFTLLAVPEDDEGIDVDRLEAMLAGLGGRRRQISFFYVVTVNNPTCTILSNRRRRRLVETVSRLSRDIGRKVPLLLDKAYEDLIHDPSAAPPVSALLYDEMGIVHEIGTVSKILAPALRVGYMIGRDSPFIAAMVQRNSDVGFSAPLITQEIAGYLLDHHVAAQIETVRAGYRRKARRVRRCIDEQLAGALAGCTGGQAGFYYYLTFEQVRTQEGSPFFRFLARTTGDPAIDGPAGDRKPRVVYIPGEFCVHPEGDLVEAGGRQLRLSYGFEETERIVRAVGLMKQAVAFAADAAPHRAAAGDMAHGT